MTASWAPYEAWPSVLPCDWSPATRGDHPDDQLDFHVDLGCGTVKKARIGIDRFEAPGVDITLDLNLGKLPFPDSSIESIITHHCLEHIGDGFVALIDDCWRVLKPEGLFRIIVPLFPSRSAVEDPDHKRYFMEDTFASFLGARSGECWLESFSVPYTTGRFIEETKACTPMFPPDDRWTEIDRREMRLTLRAIK